MDCFESGASSISIPSFNKLSECNDRGNNYSIIRIDIKDGLGVMLGGCLRQFCSPDTLQSQLRGICNYDLCDHVPLFLAKSCRKRIHVLGCKVKIEATNTLVDGVASAESADYYQKITGAMHCGNGIADLPNILMTKTPYTGGIFDLGNYDGCLKNTQNQHCVVSYVSSIPLTVGQCTTNQCNEKNFKNAMRYISSEPSIKSCLNNYFLFDPLFCMNALIIPELQAAAAASASKAKNPDNSEKGHSIFFNHYSNEKNSVSSKLAESIYDSLGAFVIPDVSLSNDAVDGDETENIIQSIHQEMAPFDPLILVDALLKRFFAASEETTNRVSVLSLSSVSSVRNQMTNAAQLFASSILSRDSDGQPIVSHQFHQSLKSVSIKHDLTKMFGGGLNYHFGDVSTTTTSVNENDLASQKEDARETIQRERRLETTTSNDDTEVDEGQLGVWWWDWWTGREARKREREEEKERRRKHKEDNSKPEPTPPVNPFALMPENWHVTCKTPDVQMKTPKVLASSFSIAFVGVAVVATAVLAIINSKKPKLLAPFSSSGGSGYDDDYSKSDTKSSRKSSLSPGLSKFLGCFNLISNFRDLFKTSRKSNHQSVSKKYSTLSDILLKDEGASNEEVSKHLSQEIDAIHGLRAMSFLWVIFGHTFCFMLMLIPIKNMDIMLEDTKKWWFPLVPGGFFAVDTFFTISGFLFSYLLILKSRKVEAEFIKQTESHQRALVNHQTYNNTSLAPEIRDAAHAIDAPLLAINANATSNSPPPPKPPPKQQIPFLRVILLRYIRLTPLYIASMLLFIGVVPHWKSDGPLWGNFLAASSNSQGCQKFWWRDLLYIMNLFEVKNMCMTWGWYMANDFQFFTISLFLMAAYLYRTSSKFVSRMIKVSVFAIIFGMICACIGVFIEYVIAHNMRMATLTYITSLNEFYFSPQYRIAPYLIGLLVGILLAEHKVTLTRFLHRFTIIRWSLHAFHLSLLLFLVALPYFANQTVDPTPRWLNVAYISTSRSLWAIGCCWIIVACGCGHSMRAVNSLLSSKFWVPLSRLSFVCYMIHCIILFASYSSFRAELYYQSDFPWAAFLFFVIITLVLAIPVYLFVEAPVAKLVNTYLTPKSNSDSKMAPAPNSNENEAATVNKQNQIEIVTMKSPQNTRFKERKTVKSELNHENADSPIHRGEAINNDELLNDVGGNHSHVESPFRASIISYFSPARQRRVTNEMNPAFMNEKSF